MNLISEHPITLGLIGTLLLRLVFWMISGTRSVKTTVTTIVPSDKPPVPPNSDAPLLERAKYALGELPIGVIMTAANSPEKQLKVFDLQIERWQEIPDGLNQANDIAIFCDCVSPQIWLPHMLDRVQDDPVRNAPLFNLLLERFDSGRVRYWFASDALGSKLNLPLVERVVAWRRLEDSTLATIGAKFCRCFKLAGCHAQLSSPDDLEGWEKWASEGRW